MRSVAKDGLEFGYNLNDARKRTQPKPPARPTS